MLDDVNQCFREPAIATETGGRAGGGAQLTTFGRQVIDRYRSMQAGARAALAEDLAILGSACSAKPQTNE
jgi:molybdate transport system regulatory protein